MYLKVINDKVKITKAIIICLNKFPWVYRAVLENAKIG